MIPSNNDIDPFTAEVMERLAVLASKIQPPLGSRALDIHEDPAADKNNIEPLVAGELYGFHAKRRAHLQAGLVSEITPRAAKCIEQMEELGSDASMYKVFHAFSDPEHAAAVGSVDLGVATFEGGFGALAELKTSFIEMIEQCRREGMSVSLPQRQDAPRRVVVTPADMSGYDKITRDRQLGTVGRDGYSFSLTKRMHFFMPGGSSDLSGPRDLKMPQILKLEAALDRQDPSIIPMYTVYYAALQRQG